jgi:radical SAM superfamily enzyme with C-terminal helix-hairpin-helix motif
MATTASRTIVILDCYTVEPSGLGVPPYLSPYVRAAYSALTAAHPGAEVRYLTIDDVRWCLNGGTPYAEAPLSDPLTYSATTGREEALRLLSDAGVVVVIAGDAVPSVHLQAQNGSVEEIIRALACVRGHRVLLGPLAGYALADPACRGLFDAVHTHTITSADLEMGSRAAAPWERLAADRGEFDGLIGQLGWRPVAEIELYRGCTRRQFCSFCNEPVKSAAVDFRPVADVLAEVSALYSAGVRCLRLGQQTCFFSYLGRDAAAIEQLLAGIREACPDLEVLHIDNADPLAVASKTGATIARLVARYCTEGNCAPMGIESFDPKVIEDNALTATPEVLMRAIAHINEAGAHVGPGGLPVLLPGLNVIYGLPGETHRTHYENLAGLVRILDAGYLCHRINVRPARVYAGTQLAVMQQQQQDEREWPPSGEHFETWKADIAHVFDEPMKKRVYPAGRTVTGLHSFFVTNRGTWYRRLGSYPIQIVERGTARRLYEPAALTVTGHAPRFIYGARHEPAAA